MTFHREGVATLVLVLVLGSGLVAAAHTWLPEWAFYLVCVGVTVVLALVVNFFRMPTRQIGTLDPKEILAPSDGKVVVIEKVHEPEWFNDERIQVSIFMSPLNVHAQWRTSPEPLKLRATTPGSTSWLGTQKQHRKRTHHACH